LTPEKILGFRELNRAEYTESELQAIKVALIQFALCRNENYSPETVMAWINEFADMNMPVMQVIKRIRLAKLGKKFGVTDFSAFMDLNIDDYTNHYKHIRLEE
jgi:hypothetical protein